MTESAVRSSTSPRLPARTSFPVLLRRIPCVMTVHNLNFLRYPHLYSLGERLVLLRLYRRMLRSASRVITVNRDAREELSDRLRIDPGRIEVVMRSRRVCRRIRPTAPSWKACGANMRCRAISC
ncbi:MAG: glycosyltransferase [Alistipes sp.]